MVKHKSQPKKPQKGGVDFKKYKRKIGRKLPPPKNATNTEIKSKAIVLPEQSIASEKEGFAVSRKGLTLKELLQHTNHHNAKFRKDALVGIKEILLKYPVELKLHKLAIIEKLRERIGDEDKLVRETLYKLFKSVVFPDCAKEFSGPLVSLLMAYVFNAMTHLAIAVRLTAFNFLDLVIQFFPSSFPPYADKIFGSYGDVLQKNQFVEDRKKLHGILAGLLRCLELLPCNESDKSADENHRYHEILHASESVVPIEIKGSTNITVRLKNFLPILVRCFEVMHNSIQIDTQSMNCMHLMLRAIELSIRYLIAKSDEQDQLNTPHCPKPGVVASDLLISSMLKKLWELFPLNMLNWLSVKDDRVFMFNTVIVKIFMQFKSWDDFPPGMVGKFIDFITIELAAKIQSGNMVHQNSVFSLIPYIPKLASRISFDLRCCILQFLTNAVTNPSSPSSMKLACISAITEMLAPERGIFSLESIDFEVLKWLQDLPSVLNSLDYEDPSCIKAVLRLQLCLLQAASIDTLARDKMRQSYSHFFSFESDNGIFYGPFRNLPTDVQELAICCLYYFAPMDDGLLKSLMRCCLCNDVQFHAVLRILEVLQSTFGAGHIEFGDYTSFLIMLLSRFHVSFEDPPGMKSNWETLKCITSIVCSRLSVIGDNYLVFKMLEKTIVDLICGEAPVHNKCALLRLLVTLDSQPTRLSDENIHRISYTLPRYLINAISNVGDGDTESVASTMIAKRSQYYLLPCFHLFSRSRILLNHVLNGLSSWRLSDRQAESFIIFVSRILSLLLHMSKDAKMLKILLSSSCKTELQSLSQNLQNSVASETAGVTFEERRKVECSYDQLRSIINSIVEQNQ